MSSQVLLKEATTDQLISELETRVEAIQCAYMIPGREKLVMQLHKGSYIEKWGLVKMLEANMRYHDHMACKDEYNDNPDVFFKDIMDE